MENKIFKIIGVVAAVFTGGFFLLVLYVYVSSVSDLWGKFPAWNVITGHFPQDYYSTTDGSTLNFIKAVWWVGVPLTIFGILFSRSLWNKGKGIKK